MSAVLHELLLVPERQYKGTSAPYRTDKVVVSKSLLPLEIQGCMFALLLVYLQWSRQKHTFLAVRSRQTRGVFGSPALSLHRIWSAEVTTG
jgi:hypothetical protein